MFFYDEYDENDDEEVWLREKREALDEQRDYQYEGHEKAFREDGKVRIISLFLSIKYKRNFTSVQI